MTQVNARRGEFYWLNERPYISVTNSLKVIDKPMLRYWYGNEIYNAMIINPNLSRQEAHSAPWQKTKSASDRGSTVHSLVEAWKQSKKFVGLEGPFEGYARAFELWVKDHNVEVLENEKTCKSDKYGYAGTMDMVAMVDGKKRVVDFKTGKDLYPEVHLQLSAYKQALSEEQVVVEGTCAVLLSEDGTYKYEIGKDRLNSFLAALTLFKDLNDDLLKKVNYEFGQVSFI